ncbi:unnamed protein product, partial [Staurois parvus]
GAPWAIGDHGAPVSLPKLKKAYEKECTPCSVNTSLHFMETPREQPLHKRIKRILNHPLQQGWTDNSWGPRAIGDHGAPVSLPKLKKVYEKGTRGISWGPPTDPGPLGSARVS